MLTLVELGKLDSAIVNHKTRCRLLIAFKGLHDKIPVEVNSSPCVKWTIVKGITLFDINTNQNLQLSDFILLFRSNPNITRMIIKSGNFNDPTIQLIAKQLQFINSLSVSISNTNTVIDGSKESQLLNCPYSVHSDAPSITDDSVIALSQLCTYLTSLNISHCDDITDKSIVALSQGCPRLIEIVLHFCNITDISVIALSHSCKNLRHIDLSFCAMVTDESLVFLSRECSNLNKVDVSGCSELSDISIISLSEGCPELTNLSLSHLDLITDCSIAALSENSSNLVFLELSGCHDVTEAAVEMLSLGCKKLEYIDFVGCAPLDCNLSRIMFDRIPALIKMVYHDEMYIIHFEMR